ETEMLRVAGDDVIRSDIHARQRIAVIVDRWRRRAGGEVAASLHVAQNALPRRVGKDRARSQRARPRAQALEFEKEERAVLDYRSAYAAAEDILLKLRLAQIVQIVLPFVRVQPRRAQEPEAVAMKPVGAGFRDHSHL